MNDGNLDDAGHRAEQLIREAEAAKARMMDVPGNSLLQHHFQGNNATGGGDEFVHSALVDQNYFMVVAHVDEMIR